MSKTERINTGRKEYGDPSTIVPLTQDQIKKREETDAHDYIARGKIMLDIAEVRLEGTALRENKAWTGEDETAVRELLIDIAPYAHRKIFSGYWDHVLLSSLYLKKIAQHVDSDEVMNPTEGAAIGLIHDMGKLISVRYPRDTFMENLFFKKVGIKHEISEKMHPLLAVIGMGKNSGHEVENVEDTTLPQMMQDVADNLGKKNPDGTLMSVEQVIKYAEGQPKRYSNDLIWPSEVRAQEAMVDNRKMRFSNQLFEDQVEYLSQNHNLDFEQIRQEVTEEYNKEENQEWLRRVRDAQETLDPEVDSRLGRPAIKTVVFDIGGVLLSVKDTEVAKEIASACNISESKFTEVLAKYEYDAMAGRTTEKEFLHKIIQELGLSITEEKLGELFVQPEIYQAIPGMPEIIRELVDNPDINLVFLSDIIPSVGPTVAGKVKELYPEIDPEKMFFSYKLKESKRDPNSPALGKLLEQLGNPNPQSVLFIDDRERYSDTARATYSIRGLTFRDKHSNNRTPVERLRDELRLAALIS